MKLICLFILQWTFIEHLQCWRSVPGIDIHWYKKKTQQLPLLGLCSSGEKDAKHIITRINIEIQTVVNTIKKSTCNINEKWTQLRWERRLSENVVGEPRTSHCFVYNKWVLWLTLTISYFWLMLMRKCLVSSLLFSLYLLPFYLRNSPLCLCQKICFSTDLLLRTKPCLKIDLEGLQRDVVMMSALWCEKSRKYTGWEWHRCSRLLRLPREGKDFSRV